ncbi:MAG TPA: tetratricopeptide repeat protein [Candidatus Binatia bacterium]|nr:tetratricopeptide repeat protein [Candidatus Binatia bacterium]
MLRRALVLALLLTASVALSRDKNESWIQVTGPHFVVVTNSSEKQGRRIADQFERMRSLFHVLFPKAQMDATGAPIIVLAVNDDRDFRALEPQEYLTKGSLQLGGLFLEAADKNYVLMRIDAEGEHPYAVIYHEYTHFLLRRSAEWMPLWMNEGLAEFYQNTDIREKDAALGQPSVEDILVLRQNRLLPLPTLLTVDRNSPYYHEENKGSIFYAESWALMHYIETGDAQQKTHHLLDYANLLSQKVDPVTAAAQVFGDLKKLQADLENYVEHGSFRYFKLTTATDVDDSTFKVQPLTAAQGDALRADFLAYNSRNADAQALLDHVLQEDPKNVQAHETKGFLEFRAGNIEEAKKWYEQAVQLDSQSFLAHYYFAAMTMDRGPGADQQRVENSLRTAIKLNPSFDPAFDRLAVLLAMQRKNLDEARTAELTAISLGPANVVYRVNMANILMMLNNPKGALQVLEAAAKVAKTEADVEAVENARTNVLLYTEQPEIPGQKSTLERNETVTATASDVSIPRLKRREFVAKGPHRFLVGVLMSVRCDSPALDLTVSNAGQQLSVHGDNYYRIPFSTLGFQPSGELNPCRDLENRPAKIEYVESADPSAPAQLLSVELRK